MITKYSELCTFVKNNNIYKQYILNKMYTDEIYNIFILNNPDAYNNTFDSEIIGYLGYYYFIHKNYRCAIKYYLLAINANNSYAMNNLGDYYRCIEKDYDQTKLYYLMAINANNELAMINLGNYYYDIEKNYERAVHYYSFLTINNNNYYAMCRLSTYYNTEHNYDLSLYYLEMYLNKMNLDYEAIADESNYFVCEMTIIINLMKLIIAYLRINNLECVFRCLKQSTRFISLNNNRATATILEKCATKIIDLILNKINNLKTNNSNLNVQIYNLETSLQPGKEYLKALNNFKLNSECQLLISANI